VIDRNLLLLLLSMWMRATLPSLLLLLGLALLLYQFLEKLLERDAPLCGLCSQLLALEFLELLGRHTSSCGFGHELLYLLGGGLGWSGHGEYRVLYLRTAREL
jgi:hypothetical protein